METPDFQTAYDIMLNNKSNKHVGCPFDMIDEVINDEQIEHYAKLTVHNRVLQHYLKQVGIKLRYPQLSNRHTVFEPHYCIQIATDILQMQHDGNLNDYIAMHLLVMTKLADEAQVYFHGTLILNK